MGMLSRLRSMFDVGRAVYGYRIDSPTPVDPKADMAALLDSYRSWCYVCAGKNAARVASQPLKLYATTSRGQSALRCPHRDLKGSELDAIRKTLKPSLKQADVAEVSDHPMLDLLNYVNEMIGYYELFETTEIDMELTGNAYWWVVPGPLGLPAEILVLPPQLVRIKLNAQNFVGSYVLGHIPNDKVIPADEVIHFRFPNPDGSAYGFGPAQAAWGSILDYRAMQQHERALNKNMGVPSLFIKYSGVVEKAELSRIESDWNRKLRGNDKSGTVMVGDNKYEIEQVGLSPRDMSFEKGRKWARVEIADCFGVPMDLLDTENSNRATATQANYVYEQFTIKPRLRRIADKLNERLVPLYDDRLFFEYDENVPRDEAQFLSETIQLTDSRIITRNEARERMGLPPMDGGDEIESPAPVPVAVPVADSEPVDDTDGDDA